MDIVWTPDKKKERRRTLRQSLEEILSGKNAYISNLEAFLRGHNLTSKAHHLLVFTKAEEVMIVNISKILFGRRRSICPACVLVHTILEFAFSEVPDKEKVPAVTHISRDNGSKRESFFAVEFHRDKAK